MTNPLRPFTVRQRREMYGTAIENINIKSMVCCELQCIARKLRYTPMGIFYTHVFFPEFFEQNKNRTMDGLRWWPCDKHGYYARVRALTRAIGLCDAKIKKGVKY